MKHFPQKYDIVQAGKELGLNTHLRREASKESQKSVKSRRSKWAMLRAEDSVKALNSGFQLPQEPVRKPFRPMTEFEAEARKPNIREEFQSVAEVLNAVPVSDDGWIEWSGSVLAPVPGDTLVGVKLLDCEYLECKAKELSWEHFGSAGDIVAYRVVNSCGEPEWQPWCAIPKNFTGTVAAKNDKYGFTYVKFKNGEKFCNHIKLKIAANAEDLSPFPEFIWKEWRHLTTAERKQLEEV